MLHRFIVSRRFDLNLNGGFIHLRIFDLRNLSDRLFRNASLARAALACARPDKKDLKKKKADSKAQSERDKAAHQAELAKKEGGSTKEPDPQGATGPRGREGQDKKKKKKGKDKEPKKSGGGPGKGPDASANGTGSGAPAPGTPRGSGAGPPTPNTPTRGAGNGTGTGTAASGSGTSTTSSGTWRTQRTTCIVGTRFGYSGSPGATGTPRVGC